MPRSHQHFRPVPTMKLLGIMNRCWSTTFHIVATKVPMDGARSGRCQCVCLTKFIWHSTSNPKCHVMFSKTKKNVNWHLNILLKCHLNVTCLVVRVISIFKVPIDVWFFLCTSHTTKSKSKLCVLIDVHFIFLCKFLHVECKKLNVKNTHWPAWSAPPVSIVYIYIFIYWFVLAALARGCGKTKWHWILENKIGTCLEKLCWYLLFSVQGQKLLHHSLVEAGGKSFPPLVPIESAGCNIMITQEIWPISKEQKVSAIFSRRPDL